MEKKRIAIIGAGVNGLACAVEILKACTNVEVTIISDRFAPDITSDVAAGIWGFCFIETTSSESMRKWGYRTLEYMKDLATSPQASIVGAELISGYIGLTPESEKTCCGLQNDYSLGRRQLTQEELKVLPGCSIGWFFTSAQLDPGIYLPWLMKSAKEMGAKVIERKVTSFEELEDYDLILNCTGLRATELTTDTEMEPCRGQVIRVLAPWVKHFMVRVRSIYLEDYIIPGPRFCVLGGVFQENRIDTEIDKTDHETIWNGCTEVLPSLKTAKILKSVSGLRPMRPEVRLEAETIRTANKTLTVIHNYGHGGAGFTFHWGCAQDVLRLVQSRISNPTAKL